MGGSREKKIFYQISNFKNFYPCDSAVILFILVETFWYLKKTIFSENSFIFGTVNQSFQCQTIIHQSFIRFR